MVPEKTTGELRLLLPGKNEALPLWVPLETEEGARLYLHLVVMRQCPSCPARVMSKKRKKSFKTTKNNI
jgi:hypothetical protein